MLSRLTVREAEIAALVGDGHPNKVIAFRLDISEQTVKNHLTKVFAKLGVGDRLGLALRMVREQRYEVPVLPHPLLSAPRSTPARP